LLTHDIILVFRKDGIILKRAVVLSGGGAKGAYQIGVWKALRKLKIDFSIVTGTSVGSLNGVLMVQDDYRLGKKLWKKMNFEVVFDEADVKKYNHCRTTLDMIQMFRDNLIKKGGMKPSNLENLLRRYFRPKKFFSSPRDFGISTYNVTDLRPEKLVKKEMQEDTILDYVIASSSCFPAFQMKKIGTKKYVDGGVFDYIPINLALSLGAEEIIAIDLHAPGIKERIKRSNVPITYIEPNNDIGSFLNFNSDNAKRAMRYGYLDAMKVFSHLEGEKFSFRKNMLEKMANKLGTRIDEVVEYLFDFTEQKSTLEEFITLSAYKRMNRIRKGGKTKMILTVQEKLADIFSLEATKVYGYASFSTTLWKTFKKTQSLNDASISELIEKRKLTSLMNRRAIIKYFYDGIFHCYQDSSRKKHFCQAALLFPSESLCAIYLYALKKEVWFLW